MGIGHFYFFIEVCTLIFLGAGAFWLSTKTSNIAIITCLLCCYNEEGWHFSSNRIIIRLFDRNVLLFISRRRGLKYLEPWLLVQVLSFLQKRYVAADISDA